MLGATTLQLFDLGVDPVQERLVPVTGLLKQLSQEVIDLTAQLEGFGIAMSITTKPDEERMWPAAAPEVDARPHLNCLG